MAHHVSPIRRECGEEPLSQPIVGHPKSEKRNFGSGFHVPSGFFDGFFGSGDLSNKFEVGNAQKKQLNTEKLFRHFLLAFFASIAWLTRSLSN